MKKTVHLLVTLLVTLLASTVITAQEPVSGDTEKDTLRIGTKNAPPFSIKQEDGTWTGLSIDLWAKVAEDLEIEYELVETDLEGLLTGLEDGSLDASVAALNVTAEREARLDFTHPFYTSGFGIAVHRKQENIFLQVFRRLISFNFLKALATLATLVLLIGMLVWALERRRNPEQFGGTAPKGIWEGFWWSAVSMTTVGYGDRYPVTVAGRLVALVWIFTSVVIVSSFTAAIASALTVGSLDARIQTLDDLDRFRVASVPNSSSAALLDDIGVSWIRFDTVEAAMAALDADKVDAVVYDEPLIRFIIRSNYQNELAELPGTIRRLDYAIGLPAGSNLREPINRSILNIITKPEWRDMQTRYLGQE